MQLSDDLIFQVFGGPSMKMVIAEDPAHDTVTLELKGILTKTVAAVLGVDWIFASETMAYAGLKDGNLVKEIKLTDIELRLFSPDDGMVLSLFPDSAYGWKVSFGGANGSTAQCKIDIGGNGDELLDYFRNHRLGFQWSLRPRQQNLFDEGDRVDMSGDDKEQDGCVMCGGVEAHTADCPVLTQPTSPEGESIHDDKPSFAEIAALQQKRGRGRPPGAKNKPKPPAEEIPA